MGKQPLAMWGGVECTRNRVGDAYLDQLNRSGHDRRPEDLRLFRQLGLRTLRYPVLWEQAAQEPGRYDWSWADERLPLLRDLGIRPIAGLVHHGSGPRSTDLLDPGFAPGLAHYAQALAERFPWLDLYTPVNEPLTTARFSGLYGFWYPHGRSDGAFCRALVTQVRATQLAMAAIRAVNPSAQLLQTEDIGRTFSTPALAYQAEFDNHRRWLSLDLLAGRVGPGHPLYDYLVWAGITPDELAQIRAEAVPPDLIGINHYVTSDRFLDDRTDLYPPHQVGGNGRDAYADVEAVRVCHEGLAGPEMILREVWDRYRLPMVISEAHIGCFPEERARWLVEVWDICQALRREGLDIRALTAWALLGSFDWDSLVTQDAGHYEPAAYDLRGSATPRPTIVAHTIRDLATHGQADHPVLDQPGWWRRPDRLLYPPTSRGAAPVPLPRARLRQAPRPVLLIGATGMLAQTFQRIFPLRGVAYQVVSRQSYNLCDRRVVDRLLDEIRPWAVINAAGFRHVDQAESALAPCYDANTCLPVTLAEASAPQALPLLTFSSHLVFDGAQAGPYVESAPTGPLSYYGQCKVEAEQKVLAIHPQALIVRAGAFFDPADQTSFAQALFRSVRAGQVFSAAEDTSFSPTYLPDLAHGALDLLLDGERGLWHLSNPSSVTWHAFARLLLAAAGCSDRHLRAAPVESLGWVARRPRNSALASERADLLAPLENAMARYQRERSAG